MSHEKYQRFIGYCKEETNIRAVILTSSRGISLEGTDQFSDYDFELYVEDIEPFLRGDEWIEAFGEVLVRWPLRPESTWSEDWITRLVQFTDGIRFDLQITSKPIEYHSNFDAGYQIVVDKDQKAAGLAKAKYENFFVKRPSQKQFEERLNAFYWDSLYVAKSLWRNELFYAKYMLDSVLRYSCLQVFIEWHIGLHENWEVNTGKCGRWFRQYLDDQLWRKIELTFAGSDIEQNWNALIALLDVVSEICLQLAKELNFSFPFQVEDGVRQYIERIRQTPKDMS